MQGVQHFDWVLKHNFAGLLKPYCLPAQNLYETDVACAFGQNFTKFVFKNLDYSPRRQYQVNFYWKK